MPICLKPVTEQKRPAPRQGDLGPNQIAWLQKHMGFFAIHKAQAEAQTGVAAVQSPGAPKVA